MKQNKAYSLVVCTYNRYQIFSCIDNIDQLDKSLVEVLIIDNNTDHRFSERIEDYINKKGPVFKYYKEHDLGLSSARNRGIKESTGDYIIFIDDDALIQKDYISNLEVLIKKYNSKILAGKITVSFQSKRPFWLSDRCLLLLSATAFGNEERILKKSEYPIGCNMIINKEVFRENGTFRDDLGRKGGKLTAYEEYEFFIRIKDNIDILYSPSICVEHVIPEERISPYFFINRCFSDGFSQAFVSKRSTIIKILALPYDFISFILKLDIYYLFMCFDKFGFYYGKLAGKSDKARV